MVSRASGSNGTDSLSIQPRTDSTSTWDGCSRAFPLASINLVSTRCARSVICPRVTRPNGFAPGAETLMRSNSHSAANSPPKACG